MCVYRHVLGVFRANPLVGAVCVVSGWLLRTLLSLEGVVITSAKEAMFSGAVGLLPDFKQDCAKPPTSISMKIGGRLEHGSRKNATRFGTDLSHGGGSKNANRVGEMAVKFRSEKTCRIRWEYWKYWKTLEIYPGI